jgi:hypothetical protein
MPWAKGQSGNPGGRPRELAGIQKLARENGPLAIQTLVEVATNGKSDSARVSAATALLDRGFGKPAQFNTSDPGNFRKATDMSDDELVAIIEGSARAA